MNTFSPLADELVRRCTARQMCAATTAVAGAFGLAIDAGMLTLGEAVDLVRSCDDANELGDAMAMLAATVPADVTPAGVCDEA